MCICTELIEETGRPPGLIFGMWGYFWPGSDKFESWKNFHTLKRPSKRSVLVNIKKYRL